MSDPNIVGMGLSENSLTFGEAISKVGRHELALLCIKGIQDELDRKPIPNKSRGRGRPPSSVGVLAQRMEVHSDSVRRWMDIKEIQASDYNCEKIANMAVKFNPEEVARILREDLTRYRDTMEGWLKQAVSNNAVRAYVENTEIEEASH